MVNDSNTEAVSALREQAFLKDLNHEIRWQWFFVFATSQSLSARFGAFGRSRAPSGVRRNHVGSARYSGPAHTAAGRSCGIIDPQYRDPLLCKPVAHSAATRSERFAGALLCGAQD